MAQNEMLALALTAGLAGLAAWAATGLVLHLLRRLQVLDRPNRRSSHTVATPRGGGLAVLPVVLLAWLWLSQRWPEAAPPELIVVIAAATLLALLCWFDDLRGLPVVVRLLAQGAAIVVALWSSAPVGTAAGEGLVFQGFLPPLLDRAASALCWLWFVNLFNFMDGIDGISGVEVGSVGLGLGIVALLVGGAALPAALALVLAAAAAGFLVWNWAPAKLFLGDVGSIPLGFLLGWLLLSSAAAGQWAVALVLPLYYLLDATITLVRRLRRGEKVWQAHREHYYQRAVQGGLEHGAVTLRIGLTNGGLILLAIAAAKGYPWLALLAALGLVAVLLHHLSRQTRKS